MNTFKRFSIVVLIFIIFLTGGNLSFARVKGKWDRSDKSFITYRLEDGTLAKGVTEINGKTYFFRDNGSLAKGKKGRMLKWEEDFYDVRPDGTCRKGWNTYKKSLYYFGSQHNAMVKDTEADDIKLYSDGRAQMSLNGAVKYKALKFINRVTSLDKPKKVQLKAIFRYLTSGKYFRYVSIYPNLKSKKWAKEYANKMLTTGQGNCYGHCAVFSAFAETIGYDPHIITGKIVSSNHEPGEKGTPHGIVKIGKLYYETLGGNPAFAMKKLPFSFKREQNFRFKDQDGSGMAEIIKRGTQNLIFDGSSGYIGGKLVRRKGRIYYKNPWSKKLITLRYAVVKTSKNYYFFNKEGRPVKGIYKLGQFVFDFSRKNKIGYAMSVKGFEKYQKAFKFKRNFEKTKLKIGEALDFEEYNNSCFMGPEGGGKERIYIYKNLKISTYLFEDNSKEIIISIDPVNAVKVVPMVAN